MYCYLQIICLTQKPVKHLALVWRSEHYLKLTRCRTKPFQLSSKSVCCIIQNLTWEPYKIAKTQKFFLSLSECTHHLIFGSGTAEHWTDNVSSWPSSTSLFMRPFGKRGLSGSKNQNSRKLPKLTKLYVSWHPNKVYPQLWTWFSIHKSCSLNSDNIKWAICHLPNLIT